jgi:late competence protein required for DNA uptake (superfamily II DNA/RNA helicase)
MEEKQNKYKWEPPTEKTEPAEEKQVCQKCDNDTFRVYIKIIIDDARLYCTNCGEPIY